MNAMAFDVMIPFKETLEALSYDNARGVLKRAGEMARTLVAVGAGRPRREPDPSVSS